MNLNHDMTVPNKSKNDKESLREIYLRNLIVRIGKYLELVLIDIYFKFFRLYFFKYYHTKCVHNAKCVQQRYGYSFPSNNFLIFGITFITTFFEMIPTLF